jgi:hypothetical protein
MCYHGDYWEMERIGNELEKKYNEKQKNKS